MKHGRKLHFAGIYLFKFILRLKIEKSSRFFSFFCSIFGLKIRVFDEVYNYLILDFAVVFLA